jgi:UMF1 family MFS transporter
VGLIFIFAFAPYFAETVVGDPVRGQEVWSLANTLVGVCVGLLAPIVGAVADRTGRRKRWIATVLAVMVPCCFALWYAMPGAVGGLPVMAIAVLIIVLNVSFEFGQVFHNAMLPSLTTTRDIGRVSGLGLAVGNVGGLLATVLLLVGIALPVSGDLMVWFVPDAPLLGLNPSEHEHDRIVGPLSGLWMLLFSLPFFLGTPDLPGTSVGIRAAAGEGLRQLWITIRRAREYSNVGLYLVARMLYNDGMVAIQAYSGIIAVGLFRWELTALLLFAVSLSPFTILGSLLGGWLDQRFGSKRTIQAAVAGTGVFLVGAISMAPDRILFMAYDGASAAPLWSFPYFQTLPEVLFVVMYMALAMMVTVAFVSSRAMMARISPPAMMAQFFGLYAVSGWATAFLGHGLVSLFTRIFEDQRTGFSAVLLLLVPAALLMARVRERPLDGSR